MLPNVVLVILTAVGLTSATSGIGKCDTSRLATANINFDEFATTNGGVWPFVKITKSLITSKFPNLTWVTKPTATKGVYNLTIVVFNKNGTTDNVGLKANIESSGSGVAVAKGTDYPYTLKFYFLTYVPDGFAYFYVCADDGEDNIDYRYVVAQRHLTESENDGIAELETQYKFRGTFGYI